MTTQLTSAEDQPEEKAEESFWASFNRADAKLLLITFAGTVAGTIASVMIVAVAVVFARLAHPPPGAHGLGSFSASLVVSVVSAAVLCVGVSALLVPVKKNAVVVNPRTARRIRRRYFWLIVPGTVLASTFVFLVLLGVAVGVK